MVDSYRAGPRAPPSWVPVYYFQQPTEGKLRQERSQVTPQHSVFLSPWISPAPHPPPEGTPGSYQRAGTHKAGVRWRGMENPDLPITGHLLDPVFT